MEVHCFKDRTNQSQLKILNAKVTSKLNAGLFNVFVVQWIGFRFELVVSLNLAPSLALSEYVNRSLKPNQMDAVACFAFQTYPLSALEMHQNAFQSI